MSAATQEAEQRGGENVSVDVHTAVKVSVGQKERTFQRDLVFWETCQGKGKGNLMTNPQRTLRRGYPSLVKYGLGEATG